MEYKQRIRFMFEYGCPPLWVTRDFGDYDKNVVGAFFVSSEGFFVTEHGTQIIEERLKGEVELEQKVQLIYEIHERIWYVPPGDCWDMYAEFEDEQEKKDFFDACDHVIKRMKEIFGDEFSVYEYDGRIVNERSWGCKKAETEKKE